MIETESGSTNTQSRKLRIESTKKIEPTDIEKTKASRGQEIDTTTTMPLGEESTLPPDRCPGDHTQGRDQGPMAKKDTTTTERGSTTTPTVGRRGQGRDDMYVSVFKIGAAYHQCRTSSSILSIL